MDLPGPLLPLLAPIVFGESAQSTNVTPSASPAHMVILETSPESIPGIELFDAFDQLVPEVDVPDIPETPQPVAKVVIANSMAGRLKIVVNISEALIAILP